MSLPELLKEEKTIKRIRAILMIGVILTAFLGYSKADRWYQLNSEKLVADPVIATVNDTHIDNEGYGLGSFGYIDEGALNYKAFINLGADTDKYTYRPYTSQIGIQGVIPVIAAGIVRSYSVITVMRIVCYILYAGVILLICLQIGKRYGILFAIVFWLVSIMSQWPANFAPNLYWVSFTWYLPMLLGLLCLNHEKKRKLIYPLFCVAIGLKCLCGYEYITTIMLSGIVFLAAEWVIKKDKRRELFKSIFIIGCFSLLGFACVFLIHSYIFGNGDLIEGVKGLKHYLVDRRTFGNAEDFPLNYANSLNASVFDVLKKYFYTEKDGIKILALVAAASLTIMVRAFILKNKDTLYPALFFLSFVSALSWLVLAKSHSYIHVHMNFVVFYLGWAQISIFIITETLISILNKYLDIKPQTVNNDSSSTASKQQEI